VTSKHYFKPLYNNRRDVRLLVLTLGPKIDHPDGMLFEAILRSWVLSIPPRFGKIEVKKSVHPITTLEMPSGVKFFARDAKSTKS
jgi:hypothetical protein